LREYWTGISGTAVSNLTSSPNYPNSPTGSSQLTSLEGPTNWADNYGTRIYVYPPATGSYTFWLASDDNGELYLSTNANPANASRIAYVSGWTNSREWTKYSTQQSVTINLTAGQKYYIEVLQKEGSGGDNVAVAWQGPGITQQVIAGGYLSPFNPVLGASIASQVNISIANALSPNNEDGVSLYPNPSHGGSFTILLPGSTETAFVTIYDILGRTVYQKNTQGSNRIQINSQLKTGVYMVRIKSDAGSFTKKLIVK
jgi:hypothetical protein